MVWLILIGLLALSVYIYCRFFKIPKTKNVIFCDGGLGAGKTAFSVYMVHKLYKKSRRRWRVKCLLASALHKDKPEEPLLYSNIPLKGIKYVPLTLDLLLRKKRFRFGSVVLIDEFSNLADQFDFKDRDVSESLREFFKLFRHEVHGNSAQGFLVSNSQSTKDIHYAFKSVLTDYLYLHHMRKFGLFNTIKCQELMYSADKDSVNITNVNNSDVEDNLRTLFISSSVFRRYDTHCFSGLTDNLPVDDNVVLILSKDDLKVDKVLTFRKGRYK